MNNHYNLIQPLANPQSRNDREFSDEVLALIPLASESVACLREARLKEECIAIAKVITRASSLGESLIRVGSLSPVVRDILTVRGYNISGSATGEWMVTW